MFKPLLLFCTACLFLFFAAFKYVQKVTTIVLVDERLPFSPREFYIAGVKDARLAHIPVASLITWNASNLPVKQAADLQDGPAAAIQQYLARNLPRDTRLWPVMISIKDLKLTEVVSSGNQVSGELAVKFLFDLQQADHQAPLTDYTVNIHYERPAGQTGVAELMIRRSINEALQHFNTWITQQAGSNILLAKAVKVTFTDYAEKTEGDTIYYAANRPLTWADFRGRPMQNGFEAEVFTSIGYTESTAVINGIVQINMVLKVDISKSDCWVREGSQRDAYTLNHEQRHFDIEKLVSEHFKQKIMALQLPVENYDGPINIEYLETLREATRMQKQYDDETRHGTDHQAQSRWNEKIDKALKELGINK